MGNYPEFVKILTEVNVKNSEANHELQAKDVVPVYGVANIKAWCAKHKGKRFLEMMSIFCFTCSRTILLDKSGVCIRRAVQDDCNHILEEEVLYKVRLYSKIDSLPIRGANRVSFSLSGSI